MCGMCRPASKKTRRGCSTPTSSDFGTNLVLVVRNELLDLIRRAMTARTGVLDRSAESDIVLEVIGALGVFQELGDVLTTTLMMTALPSPAMRFLLSPRSPVSSRVGFPPCTATR